MTLYGMVVEKVNPVWDFHWLCTMMKKRNKVSLQGHEGIINGIRPEDGSGNNWLVTICDNNITNEIYVRTA